MQLSKHFPHFIFMAWSKFFFFFLPNYFYPHLAFTVLILDTVSSYWIPFEVIFDKIKLKVLLVRHLMESELMWKEAWTGRHITHSPSNINVKCLGWVIEWLKMIRQKRSRKCLTLWEGQPSVTLHLVYLSYIFVCTYTVNVCANELANRKIVMLMGYEFKYDFFFQG